MCLVKEISNFSQMGVGTLGQWTFPTALKSVQPPSQPLSCFVTSARCRAPWFPPEDRPPVATDPSANRRVHGLLGLLLILHPWLGGGEGGNRNKGWALFRVLIRPGLCPAGFHLHRQCDSIDIHEFKNRSCPNEECFLSKISCAPLK